MQITRTHNGFHLGDNLVHLHFLRKVALANPDRQFVHAAQWQYLKQLQDVVDDVPNLSLTDFNYRTPSDSIDAWRGANNFWYQHPNRNDFVNFHLDAWFPYLCQRMNVENPMRSSADMLFDYPAIIQGERSEHFDILVINSRPGSGQWSGFNEYAFGSIIRKLMQNLRVITTAKVEGLQNAFCTADQELSVTSIGAFSLSCNAILMVSTGPSWPTFNIWNQDTIMHRIILLDEERVNLAPNTVHCRTIDEAEQVLKDVGLL